MRININKLSDSIKKAVTELKMFELAEDGIVIFAENCDENRICYKNNELIIYYKTLNWFFRGLLLFKSQYNNKDFSCAENSAFTTFGVMFDNARNAVRNIETIKKLVRNLALMGYNMMQLYTEDAFEVDNEPYFGYLRGGFTKEEFKTIDAYCKLFGIELVPCVQLLAHLNGITRWREYAPIIDIENVLMVGEQRTYELIDNIFSTLAQCFSSRNVNIGLDEAGWIGRGMYLNKNGYENNFEIFIKHLLKIEAIATKYGFTISMWSDMIYKLASNGSYYGKINDKEILNKVPKNIELIYWDYYNNKQSNYDEMFAKHKILVNNISFACGAWTWNGFSANNMCAMQMCDAGLKSSVKNGIKKAMVTVWGDNGGECSAFGSLPTLLYNAGINYGNNLEKVKSLFFFLTNCSWEDYNSIDLPDWIGIKESEPTINPSKYTLYNDCFMGIFDSCVNSYDKEKYLSHIVKLKNVEKNKNWGYIFKTLRLLCEIVYIKYDLGVKTRFAYKAKDKKQLLSLADNEYKQLHFLITKFVKTFKQQWQIENKMIGFEVQEIRLGGLLMRIASCRNRLYDFCNDKIQQIDELELELLDFMGGGKKFSKEVCAFNTYSQMVTTNAL